MTTLIDNAKILEEISGYAFPLVPVKHENDMQILVSEFVISISKMNGRLNDKQIGYMEEVAKMAFSFAMNFISESRENAKVPSDSDLLGW